MCYGYHIWSKEALMQAENDDDLDGGQRSSEVKWGKLCAMATIFGQKKCWCKLRMMMTLMEVKGHQRSNGVNYVLWLPYLVKEALMQAKNDDDLDGGQRSSEVKWVSYVLWLPYLVKRSTDASWEWWWPWWRSKVIRGQMGSTIGMATIFCQKKCWCKLRMMMTFMEVKGHQRSNVVNFVIWLSYLVKRTTDAS